ncbi:unnamed protein product [Symbiodinium natans]|uniref:Uncharacterized protein n=1 Tax=Symbiodinium natans TaxID=878477 RepID=A0A812S6A4_9DINO|nr:unnamed protein product [Symbiodinium natans]
MFSWCLGNAGTVPDEHSHAALVIDFPDENCYAQYETHHAFRDKAESSQVDEGDLDASISTAASSFHEEVGTGEAEKTLKLTFKTPDREHVEVLFHSTPLCVRFSKSVPLTVTAVGTEFSGSAHVETSWVLTHVDDLRVDTDYKYAAHQIRLATRSLPRRTYLAGRDEIVDFGREI